MAKATDNGTERLCLTLYGTVRAKYYLGGADARMLHDAAAEIERLQAVLKQAYIDGGCREDEAEEMVRAVSTKEYRCCACGYMVTATSACKCGKTLQTKNTLPHRDGCQCGECARDRMASEESDEPVWVLTCCGSKSGVHLIGCQSEDALAGRIHRLSEKDSP